MKLLPQEIATGIPALYSQEAKGTDALAVVKFFTPWTSWTWYVSEYDPTERLCFGLVIGHERELGYFSLDELEEIRGPGALTIERDLYWKPTPLKECGVTNGDTAQNDALKATRNIVFKNFYRCPNCGGEWEFEDDSALEDDCGGCGTRHITPYKSVECQ